MKRGFTLVEFIVYTALTSIVLVLALNFITDAFFARVKSEAVLVTGSNARFGMERMIQDIREAKAVNVGSSVFGTNPGVLSLQMPDGAKDPTVFDVSSGQLRVASGGSGPFALTSSTVTVSNLVFTNLSSTPKTKDIKIQVTVETGQSVERPEFKATATLESSATLRGK